MSHRRKSFAMAGVAVLAVVAAGPTLSPLPAQAASLPVRGYQFEGDPVSLISDSAAALGSVGVDGVNISSNGASVTVPDADARAQLAKAKSLGKPAVFLVGNFSESLLDFDEPAAFKLLSSTANINTVVATLKNSVSSQGWDGVDVDLEALLGRDRAGLVTFVKALRAALPSTKSVSIAISNYQSLTEFSDAGYDLAALGSAVDRVELMAYDHHGFGDSGPGPVGDLPWQTSGLNIVLGKIAPAKVDLGVAGYGYRWYKDWASGHVDQVSDAQARQLAGSKATWNATAHEWTATLTDGSILWWSDQRSFIDRRPLANSKALHGLVLWVLGLSDKVLP